MNREKLARIIWEVEAEDDGRFAVGVTSEAAHNIADRILQLLAKEWGDGYLAGLADMQNGQERPNPYRTAVAAANGGGE